SRHCQRRRMTAGLLMALAVGLLALGLTPLHGQQDFLSKSLVTPGEANPIILNADHTATWTEGGQRVWLLKGKVKIEQGLNSISCAECALWVDEDRRKSTGIYSMEIYGDGP